MTRRILVTVIGVTVLAVAAFFVPAALAIRNARERGDLLELQREASVVASRVPATGPIDESALEPLVDSSHPLALYGPDGVRVEGVGPSTADHIVEVALDGNFAEGRVGSDLVAAVPVRTYVDGSNLVLRIEAPGAQSRSRLVRAILELAAVGVVIIAVAAIGATAVARRLNRPIDELRDWAADPNADREPPGPTGVVELDTLRAELIADRGRIGDLLSRERSFSSQVSHQLRTPVAAMRVAVETELTAPRDDPDEVLHEVLGQVDRLESTIGGLLALARHDRRPVEPVDVRRTVDGIVGVHRQRLAEARTIDVIGPEIVLALDRTAIEHVVDVLVDNAVRHGAGDIAVDIDARPPGVRIEVADNGRRPSDRDVFAEDGADRGHGIGLRLARTLAESAGGALSLLDGTTTTFRLDLPAEHPSD